MSDVIRDYVSEKEKETFLILKYGSMENAELYWWGKIPSNEDQWEVYALRAWQEQKLNDQRRTLQKSKRVDEKATR